MALGAEAKDVRRLKLRAGGLLSLPGTGAGLGIAFGIAPLIETIVASSGGRSPLPYVGSSLLLGLTTIVAAWVPVGEPREAIP